MIRQRPKVIVEVVDGRTVSISRDTTPLLVVVGSLSSHISFNLIPSPAHPIILGLPWLQQHNPDIDWLSRTVLPRSKTLASASLNPPPTLQVQKLHPKAQTPIRSSVEAAGHDLASIEQILVPKRGQALVSTGLAIQVPPGTYGRIAPRSGLAIRHAIDVGGGVIDADYRGEVKVVLFNHSDEPFSIQQGDRVAQLILEQIVTPEVKEVPSLSSTERGASSFGSTGVSASSLPQTQIPVSAIPGKPLVQLLKSPTATSKHPQSSLRISTLTLSEFVDTGRRYPDSVYAIMLTPISSSTPSQSLPAKYQDFQDVFDKKKASTLPPHRPYDCAIDLEDGKAPPWGPIYGLSPAELTALREYIDENLANGFIQHSSSPAGAPVFFVSKKDGSLRLVVDYRGLNKITKRNRYPLPLISELLERLSGAKHFTKIDLRGAYNLIRIKPGDEWKTAFRTRYGHFEYTVMPFGLTNAPAVFQHMANDIFREFLDLFVIIYLDDILVYSKTQEEHDRHVRQVLAKLREHGLYAKLEKCAFDQDQVEFLGFIISAKGISMDPKKVQTILDWQPPSSVRDVQCFLGFANFYRQFIKDFSKLALPLTKLTHKDKPFAWTPEADKAFNLLRQAFTSAPILIHADPLKPYIMEADASDFALGAVLSQVADDERLHPIAFHSRKFTAPEINYEVHDKELLAIEDSFEEWREYLEGSPHQITVYTDHRNLQYFQQARVLNRRQARWSQFLARFNFVIKYRPGKQQAVSDALSRRMYMAPSKGDPVFDLQEQVLLGPDRLQLLTARTYHAPEDTSIMGRTKLALTTDPLAQDIMAHIQGIGGTNTRQDYELFSTHEGLLFRNGLLYIPAGPLRLQIMQARHDTRLAGHFGVAKSVELISRDYWWPQLRRDVEEFIRTCDTCCRAKTPRHKPYGLLQPIAAPTAPWTSISMDFLTDLPPSDGFDAVLVVVDRFTKMAHFIPCLKSTSSEEAARLVLREVFRLHGFPTNIVSDRGPQFVAKFWKQLLTLLGIKRSLSSGYHPESDGQSERTIQTLEQYLRCFASYQQDNWPELLPLAEFAYNNTVHSSTGQTPFFALTGSHPRWTFEAVIPCPTNPAAVDRAQQLQQQHDDLRQQLEKAQTRQKVAADRHRLAGPHFKVGDKVWLLRRHIRTTRPCEKLDYERLGPFTILEAINDVTFRLGLPASLQLHPVFHVSLLEPYRENTIPGRIPPPPPTVEINDELEYEVAEILDSRFIRHRLHYLVDWLGYPPSERTWEPVEHLEHAAEKIREFHARFPTKPGPVHPRRTGRSGRGH